MVIPAHRLAFARLLHRDLDLTGFFDAADRLLARYVPFDASCWLSLDPETLLPTSHYSRTYGVADLLSLVSNEFLEDDFNKFRDLARTPSGTGVLSMATAGRLERSPRHAEFLVQHGFGDGDELRAVIRDGSVTWGAIAIHRRTGRFDETDAARVADVAGLLAHGVRRAIVRSSLGADRAGEGVGLVLLGADGTIEAATRAARRWLGELYDSTGTSGRPPMTVASVADQARRAGAGLTDEVASARVPSRSGGWLRLDASLLDDDERVAVMLSSGADSGVADVIARAHGLSTREREVVSLTLRGLSTREMAAALGVTPYTVQDHLKSIFDKVGVRSRRELAAQLFIADVVPGLALPGDRVETAEAVSSRV
jgi:DNA-binding CsgD family transcriptional regulator